MSEPAREAASPLLEVEDVAMEFGAAATLGRGRRGRVVRALDGVSLTVQAGETLALVGESGCGKSTLARCVLRVHEPTSGTVRFRGREVTGADRNELRAVRREMQLVFQDSGSSMNPRMRVRDVIAEPLAAHKLGDRRERDERVDELLSLVGLDLKMSSRFPHEFSGGQRQRIAIARALALSPALIICDESVAALDVSIQAQILNLLQDLQERLHVAYLFISHDLAVVNQIAHRVAVMYLGRIVEVGSSVDVFTSPSHPYTQALLDAVPIADPRTRGERRVEITGDTANAVDALTGCAFAPRCPNVSAACTEGVPQLVDVGVGHSAACVNMHVADPVAVRSS